MKIDDNVKSWAKTALMIVLFGVSFITSCGVWNGVHFDAIESFYGWMAGVNLVSSGVCLYFLNKIWLHKPAKEDVKKINN